MIGELITRSSLFGSASSAAWFSIAVDVPENPPKLNKQFKTTTNHWPKEIKDEKGLELYEKIKGCKFVFIKDWNKKQAYNAEGVIKQLIKEKTNHQGWWRAAFESSFKYRRNLCNHTKILVLDKNGNQFKEFK